MRQALIVIVLTLLIVVVAVGGGSALYILMGRTLFPASDVYDDDYYDDWNPGVRVGEGYLDARDVPVAGRMGIITDMVCAELDPVAGRDIGLASAEGVAILDESYQQKGFGRIAEYVDVIAFYQRSSDHSFFVYNCDGYGEDSEVATFDMSGKLTWKYTAAPEYVELAVGDLDRDGQPEYVIQYSESDDESTLVILDHEGKERTRIKSAYLWGMRVPERILHGKHAVVTIQDGERLVYRSERGHVLLEQTYADMDGNLCIVDGFGDPDRQCVLVSEPGLLRLIDGSGATVLNLAAPELDYADAITATPIRFEPNEPQMLAVLAPTMEYEGSHLYLYTHDGALTYFGVFDGGYSSLLALEADGTRPVRLLAGGEDVLREFTRAPQAPFQQAAEQQPAEAQTAEQQAP